MEKLGEFMTKVNVLKIQLYINLVLAVLLIARYHDIYFEVYYFLCGFVS